MDAMAKFSKACFGLELTEVKALPSDRLASRSLSNCFLPNDV